MAANASAICAVADVSGWEKCADGAAPLWRGASPPSTIAESSMGAAMRADLLLAIGTSLQVYPVAGVVPLAKRSGARVVILNAQPTPFDGVADSVLRQPIGEILPALCAWDAELR